MTPTFTESLKHTTIGSHRVVIHAPALVCEKRSPTPVRTHHQNKAKLTEFSPGCTDAFPPPGPYRIDHAKGPRKTIDVYSPGSGGDSPQETLIFQPFRGSLSPQISRICSQPILGNCPSLNPRPYHKGPPRPRSGRMGRHFIPSCQHLIFQV